jgi:hypothetical protein
MKQITLKNCVAVGLSILALATVASADPLEKSFVTPPPSARPWVYWMALDGNLTKEGITADLEAMARVGIGGVLYLEVRQGSPPGPIAFASPEWMEMNRHICNEAKRLGLEVNFNNDAGWTGSGGPWITPEMSMQKLVWSEAVVDAGATVVLLQPKSEKDFYRDIAVLAMPAPSVDGRIDEFETKSLSPEEGSHRRKYQDAAPADFKEAPAGAIIPRDQLIDLTAKMDPTGKLQWTPPAGKWLVMRFGHTTTGLETRPAPEAGTGLESDKLSVAATELHFSKLMGKIIQQNSALTGQDKTLVGVHIDSWELGGQNWTPLMREEFKKRRGYDVLPFLPAFSGRIVGSTEATERFLFDLRQTVSDMIVQNYTGTFQKLARKNGLRLTIEAYGGPAENMAYAGACDEPMGEFWAYAPFKHDWSCLDMASAAHTYGKPIISGEAFTSVGSEKWLGHPGNIKYIGDWAFCEGINRIVFHRYAAQPWNNVAPGMAMGPWGLHYERTQTWWEQSKAWHQYLARCQSLLQQGNYVADIAYLAPEGAPRQAVVPPEAQVAPRIRGGYGYDACSPEVVMTRMSVKDGKIVLPDGMSYRTLVLPESETMTPALLGKVKELADAGAMIVGPAKPPRKSPSLLDMGAGDEKLTKTASELWASGKILTGKSAQEFLGERGVPPDFSSSPHLRHIHRSIGDAEVYFVANPEPVAVNAVANFRITGRQPEIWWPDTGRMENSGSFVEDKGSTRVALHLEPNGSAFVVFRKPVTQPDSVVALRHEGKLQWSLADAVTTEPKSKITILKAIYGDPNDPKRTRDVKRKVQGMVDGGETQLSVSVVGKPGDVAPGVLKVLSLEYRQGDRVVTLSGNDRETLSLKEAKEPSVVASITRDGNEQTLATSEAGNFELRTSSGATQTLRVPALPATQEITGPWKLEFSPKSGGPREVTFAQLEDWSKRPEDGIKHYSGTAVYRKSFVAPTLSTNTRWMLDLGSVEVMAEVRLNGKDLGILWKSPYQVDVTTALQPGENQLEIKVVNLWANRQIGDENLPDDTDRKNGSTMKEWPEWLQKGEPSPTGRFSFTTWRAWKKGDALVSSGLIGPVTLKAKAVIPVP